jgi:branched-chain amino acid transport system substrate-binding protein
VEGAVFVDGFFRYSGYPFVKEFVNRSFERYGEEPTILEAQGFDAAGIMLSLAGRADVRTRDELRRALARLQNYPGVTGATSFDERGDAQKVLFLLQVKNGNIVQIN